MKRMEKATICDSILRQFQGNGAIYWEKLREEFKANMHDYHVTENNINFLIADGMLKRNNSLECLNLTEKGFATLAEIDTLGYVAKENERIEQEATMQRRIKTDRGIQITILIISLLALVISVIALVKSL
jgi:hypothetical protein